jgi:serine/threonine-protein kinase
VLKGFDRELKRYVAIKVLAPHLAHNSLAKKRFAREAQAAAAVVHPNVLAIHQVQPHGRLPFLVMPLVTGESLAERLAAHGILELKEILRIGMQAAAGLAAAHEQGLVHRDVKPANILLEKGVERAVLTDFGLARAADDVTLTRYGIIAGTPQYMSPEQAKGEAVDARSDLFSLGCVLYEMASGVSPFRTDSMMATLRRLIDEPPQALAALNPELPPWFVAIVERLMEKDPSRRFNSAKEVSELLEGCLAYVQQPANVSLPAGLPKPAPKPKSIWRKPVVVGIMALFAVLAAGVLGWFMLPAQPPPDIAGQWSGENWGTIVLSKSSETEYTGTFTDTVSSNPGSIQLRWSRIEQRFNGTWREGEDRFGELSVRLVGGEIRGALTTDRASKINPGTPKLADLLWVRASGGPAASGKQSPAQNWTFGPTLVRTLICPSDSPKSPLGQEALRLADGKVFNLPKKAAAAKDDLPREKLDEWYNETKINLVIDYWPGLDRWMIKLRNVKIAELAETPTDSPKDWKTLSADELQNRFSELGWIGLPGIDAALNQIVTGFHSPMLPRGMNPPMTFAFETSGGQRGILQFMATNKTATHRNVLIRYKLIQKVEAPANVRAGGVQWADFGVGLKMNYDPDGLFDILAQGNDAIIISSSGILRPMLEKYAAGTGNTSGVINRAEFTLFYQSILAKMGPFGGGGGDAGPASPAQPKAAKPPLRPVSRFQTNYDVKTIACSVDGKLIAVANGNPTRTFLKEDGSALVDPSWMPSAQIYDGETGKPIVSLKLKTQEEDAVLADTGRVPGFEITALAFSPDGSLVATGTNVGQVKIFNARTGKLVTSLNDAQAQQADKRTPEKWRSFQRALGSVASLVFSPDGSLLASCGGSFADVPLVVEKIRRLTLSTTGPGRLKVWEVKTGALKYDLAGHDKHAEAVSFSADGSLLASAGSWNTDREHGTGVIVWDLKTGNRISTLLQTAGLEGSNGGTHAVAFSPTGKSVVIGSRAFDNENSTSSTIIRLAYAVTGVTQWQQKVTGWANPKAFSPDGKSVAVLCGKESIRFFDTETGTLKHEMKSGVDRWNDFAIAAQGNMLVIGGTDAQKRGLVTVWDLEEPR